MHTAPEERGGGGLVVFKEISKDSVLRAAGLQAERATRLRGS